MNKRGSDRYDERRNTARERSLESWTPAGTAALEHCAALFHEGLLNWLTAVHPSNTASLYLSLIPPEAITYIVCRQIINRISQNTKQAKLVCVIGAALEVEFHMERLEKSARWWKAWERLSIRPAWERRKRILKAAQYKWDLKDCGHVGLTCIALFREATGWIQVQQGSAALGRASSARAPNYVQPTDEAMKWLADKHGFYQDEDIMWLPMEQEPKPWTTLHDGGYRGETTRPMLTMRYGLDHTHVEEAHMPRVYSAVNFAQRTEYRINEKILEVIDNMITQDGPGPDFPTYNLYLPKLPKKDHLCTPEEWRIFTLQKSYYKYRKRAFETLRHRTLWCRQRGELYKGRRLWFPVFIDFRGRIYQCGGNVTPQGSDMAKALFQFAKGCKIGRDGAGWLMVHGANCWGLRQKSFAERTLWVQLNWQMITAIARDPWANKQWHDAAQPWEFLAFCFDYGAWYYDRDNHISHTPCRIDGMANGFQIVALLTRNEKIGRLTNCTDSEVPEDIYQYVADKMTESLKISADPIDREWLSFLDGRVDRTVVKGPMISQSFGGTKYSLGESVIAWMYEYLKYRMDVEPPFKGDIWRPAHRFTDHLYEAMTDVMGTFRDLRQFINRINRGFNVKKKFCQWESYTGLPVRNEYRAGSVIHIRTKVLGKTVTVNLVKDTEVPDGRKASWAATPNFLQTLDAAGLTIALNIAEEMGVEAVAPLHDCFGVLASDVGKMSRAVREAYVTLFDRPVLELFREETGSEKVEMPEMGKLDPKSVLSAAYFFS